MEFKGVTSSEYWIVTEGALKRTLERWSGEIKLLKFVWQSNGV